MDRTINIRELITEQYDRASYKFLTSLALKFLLFLLNLTLAYLLISNKQDWLIWGGTVTLVGLAALDYYLTINYRKNHGYAEKLRRIQFDYYNLKIELNHDSFRDFQYSLNSRYLNSKENYKLDYKTSYFEGYNLKYSLQQSIYYTSTLFEKHKRFFYALLITYIIVMLSAIVFIIYIFTKKNPVEDIARQIDFFPKFIQIAITSFIAFNFIQIYTNFKGKSDKLKELNKEITKTTAYEEKKVYQLLIDYNSLLSDSYPQIIYPIVRSRKPLIKWHSFYDKICGYLKANWESSLQKTAAKSEMVKKEAEYVKSAIKKLFDTEMKFRDVKVIGSYEDDTFVSTRSDIDLLLIFEKQDEENSDVFYTNVFEKLKIIYGENVVKTNPTYSFINFSEAQLEILPAYEESSEMYKIPISGKWEIIMPEKHQEYFSKKNAETNEVLSKVYNNIKEIRYRKEIKLSSFYMQMYLCSICNNVSPLTEENLTKLFYSKILAEKEHILKDPLGKCPDIKGYYSVNNELASHDRIIFEKLLSDLNQ